MGGRKPDYDLVRDRLVHERKRRGLNLREAAAAVGVSAPTLSRIERGASRPDVGTLDALVAWLGLDRSVVYNAPRMSGRTTPEEVAALLQADRNLDTRSADALAAIFAAAYTKLAPEGTENKKPS